MRLGLVAIILAVVMIPAAVLAGSVIDLPTSPERIPLPVHVSNLPLRVSVGNDPLNVRCAEREIVGGHVGPVTEGIMVIPAGVVLTDYVMPFSNCILSLADDAGPYPVNTAAFGVSLSEQHLQSGIVSDGSLTIHFVCQGVNTAMWTGYRP